MLTNEEEQRLNELMNSNKEFAYFIDKAHQEGILLASQISHEFRNPLTLIKSTVQLIESMHPEIKDFKYWDQLNTDISESEALLTDFSKFNNGLNVILKKQDFLLLIKSVECTFRPMAEQKGIDLTLSIAKECVPYFSNYPHDPIKMQQVFKNLIRNAFEATEKGNYINIECKVHTPTHLTVAVHNNGQMIPEEILPTIFEPFITYKSGGSGLGLAISSRIVKAHNGIITVSSSEEQTSFIVNLPLN
ncbi:MAG: hypothetical protein K0R92_1388 [Lachnospiraceae bacterium]|nr:hypothetical protein [Lachnospiraceae bacterium]